MAEEQPSWERRSCVARGLWHLAEGHERRGIALGVGACCGGLCPGAPLGRHPSQSSTFKVFPSSSPPSERQFRVRPDRNYAALVQTHSETRLAHVCRIQVTICGIRAMLAGTAPKLLRFGLCSGFVAPSLAMELLLGDREPVRPSSASSARNPISSSCAKIEPRQRTIAQFRALRTHRQNSSWPPRGSLVAPTCRGRASHDWNVLISRLRYEQRTHITCTLPPSIRQNSALPWDPPEGEALRHWNVPNYFKTAV